MGERRGEPGTQKKWKIDRQIDRDVYKWTEGKTINCGPPLCLHRLKLQQLATRAWTKSKRGFRVM